MGWKLKKVDLNLNCGEEKDVSLVLAPEKRAVIHGIVKFPNGAPVKNALVKLFKRKSCDSCELIPITFTFTDECGQFLFGVVSEIDFIIKVFFYTPEKSMPCDEHVECKPCDSKSKHYKQY